MVTFKIIAPPLDVVQCFTGAISSSVNTLLELKGAEGKKLGKGERRSVGTAGLQPPAPGGSYRPWAAPA